MLSEKLKYLSDTEWLTLWPSISVVLFTLIFIFIIIMVIRFKKKDISKWEALPLDDEVNENELKTMNSEH